jgi:hypothetical protein
VPSDETENVPASLYRL